MRHLLYGLAACAMMVGALITAFLPYLTDQWFWFGVIGALATGIGVGGWVLAGATAGDWPRPRAGWVLMIGGLLGGLFFLVRLQVFPFLWAVAEAIAGALLTFPLFPSQRRAAKAGRPGPVQAPPVTRRQAGRPGG